MSRSQGHRKSQSTSALAVIAAGGPIPSGMSSNKMSQSTSTSASTSSATPRASRRHQASHSRLGAVIEDDRDGDETGNRSPGIDSDLVKLQRAMDERKTSEGTRVTAERRESRPVSGMDELKSALNDVRHISHNQQRSGLTHRYARSGHRNVDVFQPYARLSGDSYKSVPSNQT